MPLSAIDRPHCWERLRRSRENGLVKVLTGPRQAGKSFLLQRFRETLLREGIEASRLLTFDLEAPASEALCDPQRLQEAVLSRLVAGKTVFVFIDEVQHCTDFGRVLLRLARDGVDLYVTSSVADPLSGESAASLAGRCQRMEVLPLSFAEWQGAAKEKRPARENFRRFMTAGGFPAALPYREDEPALNLVASFALSESLLKDVLPRRRLRSVPLLRRILRVLAASVGRPLSLTSLQSALSATEPALSPVTLAAYVEALVAGGLFFKAERFDARERRVLKGGETLFWSDPGLWRAVEGVKPEPDALLKNVVFLELRRRYERVWTAKAGEADFIVEKEQAIAGFRVAKRAPEPVERERTLHPRQAAKNAFPCFLLTLDGAGGGRSGDGVQPLDVVEWLLREPER